jgi:hypothetical protein
MLKIAPIFAVRLTAHHEIPLMNISQLTTTFVTTIITVGGLFTAIAPSYAAPSPSKGVICPTGFKGESPVAGQFRCVNRVNVLIENVCTNPTFPKLNLRVGRDVCSKENVTIPATGPLTGLTKGSDFVDSKADPDAKKKAEERLEQALVSGKLILPRLSKRPQITIPIIPAGEREAVFVSQTLKLDDGNDIDDHTLVTFDVFTFPAKKQ